MKASHSIISKSRAILICALVIGALAEAGAYWYVQNYTSFPASASALTSFQLGNLTINPTEASVGQAVNISVGAVNVGDVQGSNSLSLKINDTVAETKKLTLAANESQIVNFSVNETVEGSYNVTVGDQFGLFSVSSKPAPIPAELKVSNVIITPVEAWINQPVNISFEVRNTGTEDLSYRLPILVNSVSATSINLKLSAGATASLAANVSETDLGAFAVSVGGSSGGSFHIVPTGNHTLHIISSRPARPLHLTAKATPRFIQNC